MIRLVIAANALCRAMGSVTDWHEILAGIRALYDLVKFDSDYQTSFLKYRSEIKVYREAQRVAGIFHSSRNEIDALVSDIGACRHRLESQGSGNDRSRCLCRILSSIKEGNGGSIPPIDEWERMHAELGCAPAGESPGSRSSADP